MKDEKKVNKAEEVKEEIKTEEKGVELTDEQLAEVSGGHMTPEGSSVGPNPGYSKMN